MQIKHKGHDYIGYDKQVEYQSLGIIKLSNLTAKKSN